MVKWFMEMHARCRVRNRISATPDASHCRNSHSRRRRWDARWQQAHNTPTDPTDRQHYIIICAKYLNYLQISLALHAFFFLLLFFRCWIICHTSRVCFVVVNLLIYQDFATLELLNDGIRSSLCLLFSVIMCSNVGNACLCARQKENERENALVMRVSTN